MSSGFTGRAVVPSFGGLPVAADFNGAPVAAGLNGVLEPPWRPVAALLNRMGSDYWF